MAERGTLRLPAPAKLNLFLQIVGRRADGYHLLQTVFQLIDLADEVELKWRADGRIERLCGAEGVGVEQDLAVRAARALQAASGCSFGVDIQVHKRIPMGGGLGGGSSDAASVLLGLNALWGLGLGLDVLAAIGLRLGADVPVFVHGRSAWAEGVGECLQPLSLGDSAYLVLDSGVSVPTSELFQAPELTRDAPPATIAGFVCGAERGNAFESPLVARSPRVGAALAALRQVGAGSAWQVGLSGTGGCCFARFARRSEAEAAQAILSRCWAAAAPAPDSWIAEACDVSPVHRALGL
jgi:4-diphosphocytidyl-2-C-methyl-D-erythritol kinase